MRSPFAYFRKNQKTLMVVLIGLSLFAFVICSGVGGPTPDVPPMLVAIAVIAACGFVAWILGLRSRKSSETGMLGLVIGAALAVLILRTGGPPVAVRAETGDITRNELQELRNRRELANRFVAQTIFRTRGEEQARMLIPQYQFGLGIDGSLSSDRDIVTTELLRREAESLGLTVPEQAVTQFINKISDHNMTPEIFKELRQDLRLSESELFEVLSQELQARVAAEFLYDYDYDELTRLSPTLPPEQYWDYYRRMWMQQSAEVAAVPVEKFVDESVEPPPEELQQLFNEFRNNFPNETENGELAEGRPGFRQPRKVEVAYLEIPFEAVRETVEGVTAEEIEQFYQERYVEPAEARAAAAEAAETDSAAGEDDGPLLPEMQEDAPGDSADETPPTNEPDADDSESDAEAAPSEETTEPPSPAADAEDAEPEPAPSAEDAPAAEEAPTEEPPAAEAAADSPGETASGEESGSAQVDPLPALQRSAAPLVGRAGQARRLNARTVPQTQFVLLQDAPEATEPETAEAETPADPASTPDDEPSAQGDDAASAAESPAPSGDDAAPDSDAADAAESASTEEPTDAGASDTETPTPPAPPEPPVPDTEIPPLTDALREEIENAILRERTFETMQAIALDARDFVSDVGFRMNLPEDADEHLTREEGAAIIREYADEHGLYYDVTPPLSLVDLQESEDHPVGGAFVEDRGTVAGVLEQTEPRDLYRPEVAESLDTDSHFVFWKIGDYEPYTPDPSSLNDPAIREQVVETWRELQARERARERALELSELAREAEGNLEAALGGQTVTGDPDGEAVVVVPTGEFRWVSHPDAPSPMYFSLYPYPPQIRDPLGVTNVGPDFMETVFNELEPGEVGVASNFDRSEFYVVKILDREPSGQEEFERFRQDFLAQPVFDEFMGRPYQQLAIQTIDRYRGDWIDKLWEKHNAQLLADPS